MEDRVKTGWNINDFYKYFYVSHQGLRLHDIELLWLNHIGCLSTNVSNVLYFMEDRVKTGWNINDFYKYFYVSHQGLRLHDSQNHLKTTLLVCLIILLPGHILTKKQNAPGGLFFTFVYGLLLKKLSLELAILIHGLIKILVSCIAGIHKINVINIFCQILKNR